MTAKALIYKDLLSISTPILPSATSPINPKCIKKDIFFLIWFFIPTWNDLHGPRVNDYFFERIAGNPTIE